MAVENHVHQALGLVLLQTPPLNVTGTLPDTVILPVLQSEKFKDMPKVIQLCQEGLGGKLSPAL